VAAEDAIAEVDDGSVESEESDSNGSQSETYTILSAARAGDRGNLDDRSTGRMVEDAGLAVFTSPDVESMVNVLEQTGFWKALDTFEQDVKSSALEEGEWEELIVETTTAAGTTLTVGYIVWLLRSGSVVFGLVSSLPAWTMMDPLPVLQTGLSDITSDADSDDDDSLLGILNAHGDGIRPSEQSFEN